MEVLPAILIVFAASEHHEHAGGDAFHVFIAGKRKLMFPMQCFLPRECAKDCSSI